jgi:gluconolactonase
MHNFHYFLLPLIFMFLNSPESSAQRYIKDGHQTLVEENATVQKLETGFGFLEGPITDRQGNIYFTDIPKNKIHIWTIENELKTFRENSGGANGLAFLNDTTLIVCEGINRQLTEITLNGKVTVLADNFEDKKLNSPNDVWIDPKGGMDFTDPRYADRETMELEGEYVFYLTPDRQKLMKVVDDLIRPNGLLGSPDGRLLYVADRSGNANFVYTINEEGTLSNKTFFSTEGSDGMTMDTEGNIYVTSPQETPYFHVSIYSPAGHKLEEIKIPEKPGNLQFGGKDGKTLFIPSRTSLYAIKMRVQGVADMLGHIHAQVPTAIKSDILTLQKNAFPNNNRAYSFQEIPEFLLKKKFLQLPHLFNGAYSFTTRAPGLVYLAIEDKTGLNQIIMFESDGWERTNSTIEVKGYQDKKIELHVLARSLIFGETANASETPSDVHFPTFLITEKLTTGKKNF